MDTSLGETDERSTHERVAIQTQKGSASAREIDRDPLAKQDPSSRVSIATSDPIPLANTTSPETPTDRTSVRIQTRDRDAN